MNADKYDEHDRKDFLKWYHPQKCPTLWGFMSFFVKFLNKILLLLQLPLTNTPINNIVLFHDGG